MPKFTTPIWAYLPNSLTQRATSWSEFSDTGTSSPRRSHWDSGPGGTRPTTARRVHLSLDADHVPAAKAHTAIDVSGDGSQIEARLAAAGIPFTAGEFTGLRVVNCKDPAGNLWELRG